MKAPRSRRVLRTALISALALSVISATALFFGASAAELAPDSVDTGLAFSESDEAVQESEEAEAPSEEGEGAETPEASLTLQEDAGEPILEQTVTNEVSNDLDEIVPNVVIRRILTSSVYFATNYDTSFGGEIETELAKEFYDRLVEEYVTNSSDATSFAFTPTKIDGKIEVTDPDEAKQTWNGATAQAKQAEIQSELSKAFSSATAAFWNDYPEAYWVGELGYSYTPSGSTSSLDGEIIGFSVDFLSEFTITMKMKYDSARTEQDELTTYDNGVTEAVAAINEKLTSSSSRYDTVKAIHDYICDNASYDGPAVTSNDPKAHTVAPFFIDKKKTQTFVCEGYAKAFKILCGKYNIPCVLVSGKAISGGNEEAHMWNYVQMDDDNWYAVDVTWDDQESDTYYDYFLCGKTSDVFNNNKFMDDHLASGQLSTSSSAQEFVYPDLSSVAYDPNSSQTNPSSTTSTTESTTSTTESTTSTTESTTSTTESTTSTTESTTSTTESTTSTTESTTSTTESTTSTTESTTSTTESTTSTTASTTSTKAGSVGSKLNVENNSFVIGAEISDSATLSDANGNPVAANGAKIVVSTISGSAKSSLFEKIAGFDNSFDKDTNNAVVYDISLVDNEGRAVKISGGMIKVCLNYPKLDADMKNVKYKFYHQNGNNIETIRIECKNDGIWFETASFSPFVLAYSSGTDSPGTGESNLPVMIAICLGAMALLTAVCVFEKKRRAVQK